MLYIVIPVYNRINKTLQCIDSIKRSSIELDVRVVVVDDGSTDNTGEILSKKYSDVIILKGTGLLYWSGAVNFAFRYLRGHAEPDDYICLVNNDVILEDDTLAILYEQSSINKAVISSLSTNESGIVVNSGSVIKSWFFSINTHPFRGQAVPLVTDELLIPLDLFTGRCVMMPSAALYSINLIEYEKFSHYGGDDVLSIMLRRSGYSIYLSLSSVVQLSENEPVINNGFLQSFYFHLTSIKSAVNLMKSINWSLYAPPIYYRLPNLFFSVAKSFAVSFMRAMK